MKIYNLMVPQRGKGKTHWNKVGVMFVGEDKKISVLLYMFPDLKIQAYLQEPKQDQHTQRRRGPINQNPAPEYFTEDEVPF